VKAELVGVRKRRRVRKPRNPAVVASSPGDSSRLGTPLGGNGERYAGDSLNTLLNHLATCLAILGPPKHSRSYQIALWYLRARIFGVLRTLREQRYSAAAVQAAKLGLRRDRDICQELLRNDVESPARDL
jgi:hypothetical protein